MTLACALGETELQAHGGQGKESAGQSWRGEVFTDRTRGLPVDGLEGTAPPAHAGPGTAGVSFRIYEGQVDY